MDSSMKIKNEIKAMLEEGVEPKEVVREFYKMYGNGDYRSFDSIYGRFIRRWVKQHDTKKTNRSSVHLNSHGEGEVKTDIPVPDGEDTALFDVDEILRNNKLDPSVFECTSTAVTFWDAQTSEGVQKMQSVRVKVKPRSALSNKAVAEIIQEIREDVASYLPPARKTKPTYETDPTNRIAVWHAGDIHYGRECLEEEVGVEWNMELAERDLKDMKDRLIDELKNKPVSRLLMAFTGDGINADNAAGTTTHGTQQDMCARDYRIFKGYLKVMTNIINEISETLRIPIEVLHIVGNHDTETMYKAMVALEFYYEDNPNVEICSDELNHRKYRKYGNSLLTFTHGDTEKNRILDIPSTEEPEAFGASKYVYIFTEHLHSLKQTSKGQVQAYQTCSPAPGDRWTVKSGYLGSRRGSELFIIDKEDGIINEAFLNVKNAERKSFVREID